MSAGGPQIAPAGRLRDRTGTISVLLLAALAYVPSLASAPGRMPADTKLYLYLDPGGLLGRAASTFEREQFAGWVPHQQITYLWPSGPWYWLFDAAGVPDWIAHRLWIGTIMFAAGAGARWMARRLGLAVGSALVVGLVYQLTPYLLPYVSRTSLMLLPWAALGWLVGLAVLACRDERGRVDNAGGRRRARLQPWRYPALIALVVATVGSVNATALALVAPGPVLWFVHVGWSGDLRWRRLLAIAGRTAVLCVAVSSWWIAMLVVQSRHGAPVLPYSETLQDVSRNATGPEVLRGLGYWLFYVRDTVAPATTAAGDYLVSTRGILVSYAVTLVGLVGLVAASWPARRFAALLTLVGMVLAVGVHPLDSPSPLMSLLATDDGSGLALALRSSTRAVPLLVLGLALGAGALVAMVPARRPAPAGRTWSPQVVAAAAVALLAVVNLPALWGLDLVDPAIDRDEQPPAAWAAAAESLGDGRAARVLQLPGAEFGAFRWGYTVDQPLVALTDRPLVTRDLLPLGAGPAMDLLYALDDRVQEGTFEISSLAPTARLLGADTIWLANDLQFERFRTARPEPFAALFAGAGSGLAAARPYGEPVVNAPDVTMHDPAELAQPGVGTPLPPVALVDVDDALGVVRAKPTSVLLSGSGDGIVDAAAAGLLDGAEAIRYSASLEGAALEDAASTAAAVLITDSNRDRAHHWRGSQDVHGHTEPGGPGTDVLTSTSADQRLDVFPGDADEDADRQTIALQDGPVTAIASAYGEPFAYRPEDRAVMAIDGDPATAWSVGDHGDPVGERIELTIAEPTPVLTLRQPPPAPGGRTISRVALHLDDGSTLDFELGARSLEPEGQVVALPEAATPGTIAVEIVEVTEGDPAVAASRGGVGFSEIDAGLGPTSEYVRPPVDAVPVAAGRPLGLVLTRLRVDPLDPWRADPEPELLREVTVPDDRSLRADLEVRLDARAGDELLATVVGGAADRAIASARLTGAPRHAGMFAVDGDASTAWITPFDAAVGSTLAVPLNGPLDGSLELVQPPGAYSTITELRIDDGSTAAVVAVPAPDASGRSTVSLPAPPTGVQMTLTITAIEPTTTVDRRYGDVLTLPAAVAEVSAGGIAATPVDDAAVVVADCRDDLLTLDDRPVPLRFETTVGTLLDGEPVPAQPCEGALDLAAATHRLRSDARQAGLTLDRAVLSDADLPVGAETIPVETIDDGGRDRVVSVEPCPEGCWLVLGEGYDEAWSATADGASLGPPQLVDGGFNGWWLPPSTDPNGAPTTVELRWTAQRPVTLGLVVAAAGVVFCLAVAATTRRDDRRAERTAVPRPVWGIDAPPPPPWFEPVALLVLGALLISPWWGLVGAVVGVLAAVAERLVVPRLGHSDRPRRGSGIDVVAWFGVVLAAIVAVLVVWINRADRPLPNSGWTESFDHLHGAALLAVLCVTVGAFAPPGRRRREGGA